MTRPVLLTVSGRIPDDLQTQVAAGIRPRADYAVLGAAFDADVVDVGTALEQLGWTGRWLHRLVGAGPLLGWYCFRSRRRYEVIVTDGEQVGLPLALLSRILGRGTARHMMIVHIISTRTKSKVVRYPRLAGLIDRFVVYCSWQQDYICHEFGVPRERVVLSTFMVDASFFDPSLIPDDVADNVICSAGLERRDYATLLAAVRGLDVRVVIAAASPWSTQADSTDGQELPENVEIRRLSLHELRELYASARFVVMPLEDVDFQAGITTILEAMSMGRAVICSRTRGQIDTVIEGQTGLYVPTHDPQALRSAIQHLLDDDVEAERLGLQARGWVLANADVERYAHRLASEVKALRDRPGRLPTD